jgi:hypothetical protein
MNTITVKYSCGACGIHRRDVDVPEREDLENVLAWMDRVTPVLVADHKATSPGCTPRVFTELLIPITGRGAIGGPVLQ